MSDRNGRASAEQWSRTLAEGREQVVQARRNLAESVPSEHANVEIGPQQNTERKQVIKALGRLAERDRGGALLELLAEHEGELVEVERILNLIGNDRFVRFFGEVHKDEVVSKAREHVTRILQSVEGVADSRNPAREVARLAKTFLPATHSVCEAVRLDADTAMVMRRFLLTAQQAREALPIAARLSTVLHELADKASVLEEIVESLQEVGDVADAFESLGALLANAELVGPRADEQQRSDDRPAVGVQSSS